MSRSEKGVFRVRGRGAPWLLASMLLPLFASAAPAVDPLSVVRTFCRLDGLGNRLHRQSWPRIAPLVAWSLEPAWDRIVLIHGYDIGTPRRRGDTVTVEVRYTARGLLRGRGRSTEARAERLSLHLVTNDAGHTWRILGPPPEPHVFANRIDSDAAIASLRPDSTTYTSNSVFVWRHLRETALELPYRDTLDLAAPGVVIASDPPQAGDLVIYRNGGIPYQVGILQRDGRVLSASLNAGSGVFPAQAFAGVMTYGRLTKARAATAGVPLSSPVPSIPAASRAPPTTAPASGR